MNWHQHDCIVFSLVLPKSNWTNCHPARDHFRCTWSLAETLDNRSLHFKAFWDPSIDCGGHLAGNAVKCFVRLLWAAQDTWSYWCLLAAKAEGHTGQSEACVGSDLTNQRSGIISHRTSDTGHYKYLKIRATNRSKNIHWTLPALLRSKTPNMQYLQYNRPGIQGTRKRVFGSFPI